MSIYSDKKLARVRVLTQQQEDYPGFWEMFRKVMPSAPVSKQLLVADLIKVYIENKSS